MEHYVLSIFLCFLTSYAVGIDPFQTNIRLQCFQRTKMQGCNGTLVDRYQPYSKGAGLNTPDTWVYLFTRNNAKNPEFLHECGGQLPENTNFNKNAKTEIFIHGYFDRICSSSVWRDMRDELLWKGDYNVILIDWTWGSVVDYYAAIANEPVVGEQIAFVIKNIMRQKGVSTNKFHIIGHSSGAHVAGYTGQKIPNLGRITGLDPSGVGKMGLSSKQRLDKTDAQLVDVIHTSASDCLVFGLGYPEPSGDADFYVNGGSVQLSCYADSLLGILRQDYINVLEPLIPPVCPHYQALRYYKVSINPGDCQFVGVECPDYASFKSGSCQSCGKSGTQCAIMGMEFDQYYKDDGRNHTYYLDTELLCPYCDKRIYNRFKNSLWTSDKRTTRKPDNNLNGNNWF